MSKILIIGVNGFAGKHLVQYLSRQGESNIVGCYHRRIASEDRRFLRGKARLRHCDIRDMENLGEVLKTVRPHQVYFLAAAVGHSMKPTSISTMYDTNVAGVGKFYHSVKNFCPDARVIAVGSAESYGKVPTSQMPTKETVPLNPMNPYGLSKKMAEDIGRYYSNALGLDVCFTRTFHYTGPMQSPSFVISDFSRQVTEIEGGRAKFLRVGNLDARRDFSDIRDVVRAYTLLMRHGRSGLAYNVCSGQSFPISEIVRLLQGFASKKVVSRRDPERFRPLDVPEYFGDNTLLVKDTGWSPEFTLEQSVADVLQYWRREVPPAARSNQKQII